MNNLSCITDSHILDNVGFSKCDAFITIKDHKPNYINNTKCRLINPAKSDLGKVSKVILSRIVMQLREVTMFNQWENSFAVIDWFNELKNKPKLSFLEFDIVLPKHY